MVPHIVIAPLKKRSLLPNHADPQFTQAIGRIVDGIRTRLRTYKRAVLMNFAVAPSHVATTCDQ